MDDFDALYRRYLKDVYRYLLKLCKDPDLAEELTQSTFSIAFDKKEEFRGESKISTWLFGIARFEYLSLCRKRKKYTEELSEQIPSDEVLPLDRIIQEEEAGEIWNYVHKLPEPYKEVFMLRSLGEMNYRGIGNIFKKSEAWARVTFYRAKKMIVEEMRGEDQ